MTTTHRGSVASYNQHRLPDTLAVCLFTDSQEPSGLGEHMLTLASELLANHRLLFVCPPTERGVKLLERAHELGCATLALDTRDPAGAYQALALWLRRMEIDVFHCHAGIGWEGHQGVRTARESGVTAIVRTEHLPFLVTDPNQRRAYFDLESIVDQYICVSNEAYTSHLEAGIPAQKLSIVRNGIQVEPVAPDRHAVRQELGLPESAQLVLTVARMTEQKGHRFLLEAIPYVAAHVPDAHFIWVGDGPLEEQLRGQMAELGVAASRLTLAGWRGDVPRLLVSSDLFVLPSLFEGLPLVALEALAAGLPVIGTRVCGTREAIEDEVSGRLVEPGNAAALGTAMIEALTQPEVSARWRLLGKRRYQHLFSAERMGRETAALYATTHAQALWSSANKSPTTPPRVSPRPSYPHSRHGGMQTSDLVG